MTYGLIISLAYPTRLLLVRARGLTLNKVSAPSPAGIDALRCPFATGLRRAVRCSRRRGVCHGSVADLRATGPGRAVHQRFLARRPGATGPVWLDEAQ